ncbi:MULTISPECIES: hypothetical protein [Paenibacillus]|uniref:Uncharacterized protein n=1 Tax=Paenibacillus lactis TaxID=228574 RepID=A0ABS4FFQ0_9BACL|nr:hypothetical protein [Paenibacillus lactis]MBP1895076.1 hypothetical protein [Paenibacillus lactis]
MRRNNTSANPQLRETADLRNSGLPLAINRIARCRNGKIRRLGESKTNDRYTPVPLRIASGQATR